MNANQLFANTKIKGEYYGHKFTGITTEVRVNYRSHNLTNVYVKLNETMKFSPKFYNGYIDERDELALEILENGKGANQDFWIELA